MHSEQDHVQPRVLLLEHAGGGQAIQVRHVHVHEHHVRVQLSTDRQRFLAARRLADDLRVAFTSQDAAQPGARQVMVVHDHDTRRWQCSARKLAGRRGHLA